MHNPKSIAKMFKEMFEGGVSWKEWLILCDNRGTSLVSEVIRKRA